MTTYVLYGKANRDPNELVCGFYKTREDAIEFANDLPGTYDMLVVEGIDYDAMDITAIIHPYDGAGTDVLRFTAEFDEDDDEA